MKEIELKAHVYNRKEVISKLNSIANYLGIVDKKDTYYHIPVCNDEKKYISVRIRKEKKIIDSTENEQIFLTYKRKELIQDENNISIEVNDEHECIIDSECAIKAILEDLNACVALNKEKHVEHWNYTKNDFIFHIELCTVPPLGDFLEIEVLCENDDEKTVSIIKSTEEELLISCNIPLENIEKRYYSDMLNNY